MCNACCTELQGWCKAFTRTERLLTILEAVLIIILVIFLVFISLHLSVCPVSDHLPTCKNDSCDKLVQPTTFHTTVPPEVECTWVPSHRTSPRTRYYDVNSTSYVNVTRTTAVPIRDIVQYSDESDGEEADEVALRFVLALVKIRPGKDITFGCLATAVAARWALTAASCVEAIEEVDSLDAFVLLERYGSEAGGPAHALRDVRVHPSYRAAAAPRSVRHDAVALRSHDDLRPPPPPLADALQHALVALGEEYTLLGFGRFRTVESGPGARRLRRAVVRRVPAAACAGDGGADAWSLRHLSRGRPVAQQPPNTTLCAGVLFARGAPCNYCAGAPLLRHGVLHGIMADNPQCGAACEPSLYVSIPAIRDWLLAVIDEQ